MWAVVVAMLGVGGAVALVCATIQEYADVPDIRPELSPNCPKHPELVFVCALPPVSRRPRNMWAERVSM